MKRNETPFAEIADNAESVAMRPFSRRTFFKLTAVVGALTFIGATPSGRIQAWADEEDTKFFVVYILSREEVPIMVFDVSSGKPVPLEGAEVTVASLKKDDQGKSITRTTDYQGFIPMNIRSISWQRDDASARVYNLYASITVKKSGYRECFIASYFVEAGTPGNDKEDRPNAIHLATQPLDGRPYLRQLSLDGEDLQYERKLEAKVWSGNDMVHDLVVEVVATAPKANVEISILVDDAVRATKRAVSGNTAPYAATATFSEQWMRQINIGKSLAVSFKEGSGKTYIFKSDLAFGAPVIDQTDLAQQNVRISPGFDPDTAKNVTFHKFLNREEDNLTCTFPILPLTLFADAHGRIGFALTIGAYNFIKDHNGQDRGSKEGEHLLKIFTGKGFAKAFSGFTGDVKECAKNVGSLYKGPNGSKMFASKGTIDIIKRVQLDFVGFGYAYMKDGERIWNSDLGGRVVYSAGVVYTIQLKVIVVPVVVTFDGSLNLSYSIMYGMQSKDKMKNPTFPKDKVRPQKGDVYSIIFMKFEIGASVALGVAGIASAGIRGYGYVKFEFDTHPREGLEWPHAIFKLGANFDLVLQLFFLKKGYCLSNFKPWVAFDNWKGGSFEFDAEALNAATQTLLTDEDMEYVTDADLPSGESHGRWDANDGQANNVPTYDPINLDQSVGGIDYPPAAFDLFNLAEDSNPPSPANGLKPATQTLIYQNCFSNPRMRIVHTDTKSFSHDRAFMVRVVVTDIDVPTTMESFASYDAMDSAQRDAMQDKFLVVTQNNGNSTVELSETEPANANQTVKRTRIAVSEWVRKKEAAGDGSMENCWGKAEIVDFIDLGEILMLDRLNSHDIDFDVELYGGNLLIAITSTQRPSSPKPTYLECESREYLSLVKWDINAKKVVAAGSTFSLFGGGMSLFHPRILMQAFDADGSKASMHAIVYSYACTYERDSSGVPIARTAGYLAATVFDDMSTPGFSGHRFSDPTTIVPSVLAEIDANDRVVGTFEVASPRRDLTVYDDKSGRHQTTAVFSWSHQGKTDTLGVMSFVFCETFSIVKKTEGGKTEYVSTVNERSSLELPSIPYVSKLGVSNQQALFNFADFSKSGNKKKLRTVTFNQSTLQLGTLEETGETDKTQYFASFNGRRLYCVRTIDGQDPGCDPETVQKAKEGALIQTTNGPYNTPTNELSASSTPVKLYQLCEARWVDEIKSYYDFYPIAQIDFVPDNIGVICATKTHTHFTMASLILDEQRKLTNNTANIYQVDVPVGLSAMLLSVIPVAPYAMAGDTCRYLAEIANVGNAPITAITMEASLDDAVFETKRFDDLKQYVQPSCDDVREQYASMDYDVSDLDRNDVELDEEGNVCSTAENDKVAFAGILWPGKRRTYKFDFTVPKGLEKDVIFGVRIAKVEDHMDDDSFAWPQELTASQAETGGLSEDGVPLLAAEDYLYGEQAAPALEFLSKSAFDMEADWVGNEVCFATSIGSADYTEYTGGESPTAKTGDVAGMGVLLAAGAAGAAAAGVAGAARAARADGAAGAAAGAGAARTAPSPTDAAGIGATSTQGNASVPSTHSVRVTSSTKRS